MLGWLRKLLGLKSKADKSLLDIARATDSEKTRRVLAKKPIRAPTEVLAQVLTKSLAKTEIATHGRRRSGSAKPASLVEVMQAEASAHARHRSRSTEEIPKPLLAEVLRSVSAPEPRRGGGAAAPDATPLVKVNASLEAEHARRSRPTAPPPASALPVKEWSKRQQEAAMRGKTVPTAPDNSKLQTALAKEDAVLRDMAAKSAAKLAAKGKAEATMTPKPATK